MGHFLFFCRFINHALPVQRQQLFPRSPARPSASSQRLWTKQTAHQIKRCAQWDINICEMSPHEHVLLQRVKCGNKQPVKTHICRSASDRCIFPGRTGCCSWRSPVWPSAAERSQTCCSYTGSGWCCSAGDSTWRRRRRMETIKC